ncbi:cell division protein FtsQ/DivIB [Chitinivibrio alkaliphilus]|uniref:Cell division protein FtsQ n=1 Tax=Chitinivibrio alkaliphilus ACht1 TaxID=1313304 RepID=U7D9U2_9BACT|nr:FtsQ-type POTRA domain-containing protein [Chitinivibrio alkaliphilus]ERP31195.1 cell division protein FtsQ [Chitinivibrio alkaliphilus ACht1]
MAKRIGTNQMQRRLERRDRVSQVKPGRRICVVLSLMVALFWGIPAIDTEWYITVVEPFFRVNTLIVRGNRFVDRESLLSHSGLDTTMGIFSVQVDSIARKLSTLDPIDTAHVRRSLSRDITIEVVEHRPHAFMVTGHQVYFMNKEGILWPFVAGDYFDIPVVYGLRDTVTDEREHEIIPQDLRRFNRLAKILRATGHFTHILAVDMSNSSHIALEMKGVRPEIRVGYSFNEQVVENMETLFDFLKGSDLTIREYIDLSYDDVAFIK